MRVLIDTNVLFSALLFPRSKPARALLHVADRHTIVLCDRSIAELRDILEKKGAAVFAGRRSPAGRNVL